MEFSKRTQPHPDTVILDGHALLYNIVWPANGKVIDCVKSFAYIVHTYLDNFNVYLVFDRYYVYSIKLTLSCPLPGREEILKVSHNKVQLISFIVIFIRDDTKQQMLIITASDPTPVEVHMGVCVPRYDLTITNEGADLVLVQQAFHCLSEGSSCVRVVADDTDVFILLFHFYYVLKSIATVHIESLGESVSVIDIGVTIEKQKYQEIIPQLLAMHALSGCDTTTNVWNREKICT